MKLNNKGMTLVELIISVALISIVVGFLFKVVLDVKYEKDTPGFASENQINRAEIIKTIQDDFIVQGLYDVFQVNDKKMTLTNNFKSVSLTISENKKTLTYGDRKWTIKDDGYNFGNFEITSIDSKYLKIVIPVVSVLSDDRLIDDIEILLKYENF